MGSYPTDGCLTDVKWETLSEVPERDRAVLWAASLLGVAGFWAEASGRGRRVSYPGALEQPLGE